MFTYTHIFGSFGAIGTARSHVLHYNTIRFVTLYSFLLCSGIPPIQPAATSLPPSLRLIVVVLPLYWSLRRSIGAWSVERLTEDAYVRRAHRRSQFCAGCVPARRGCCRLARVLVVAVTAVVVVVVLGGQKDDRYRGEKAEESRHCVVV